MQAVILTPSLVPYDAVGNDVRAHHKILNKIMTTYIYTNSYKNDNYSKDFLISKDKLLKLAKDPTNVLIYHHSIYWNIGDEVLPKAKAKIIIKYHNITPPHFFTPYNKHYENICRMGLDQNKRLKSLEATFLVDSFYNSKDFPNSKVVPVFTLLDDFNKQIDISFADKLLSNELNILFIGRFAPNKGHKHLIKTILYLKEYGLEPKLHIAGSIDKIGLRKYYKEVLSLIEFYKLEKNIIIYNKINFKKLLTLYKTSSIFLLLSEHEGFCVPILESQISSLPIVTVNKTAIKETIGKNQIVLEDIDYNTIASSIYTIYKEPSYSTYLTTQGRINLDRFRYDKIKKEFLGAIDDSISNTQI